MSEEDNLEALKKLRALPRNTQVDSRVAAIRELLGEKEIFATLRHLRWPEGIICPRCHSSNIVRREAPAHTPDQRAHYVCLNCKGEGSPCGFDDFTGLSINSLHSLRQWILCWYLIGFCSLDSIARILGLTREEIMQMIVYGNELADLPKLEKDLRPSWQFQAKKQQDEKKEKQANVELDEEYSKSASKSPFKPGPKTRL